MRILNWQLCQSCSIEAPSLCPTLAPVFLTSMRRFTSPLCSRLPQWLRPCLPRPLSSPRQSSPGALTPMPGANLPWAYRSEEGAEEANFSAMSSTFILSQQVLRDFSRSWSIQMHLVVGMEKLCVKLVFGALANTAH